MFGIYKSQEEVASARAREIARWKENVRHEMMVAALTPVCAALAGVLLFCIAYLLTP